MNRSLTRDSFDDAAVGADQDAPPRNNRAIVTADSIEIQKSGGIDVGYNQAQFIQMPGEHEDGVAGWIQTGNPITHRVTIVLVCRRLHIVVENGLSFRFIAGRGSSVEEVDQKGGWGILRFWHIERLLLLKATAEIRQRKLQFPAMTIYPAIDIKHGRAVRLLQGRADQETVYAEEPAAVARQFASAGSDWVHVVDLDGAFEGTPKNLSRIKEIVAVGMKVQLGGGQRSLQIVEQTLAAGVSRVVIGTMAAENPQFVAELVREFGARIAVGIDANDGKVAVKGWVDTTGQDALEMARRMSDIGVQTIIYTDIGTDGMLTGPNLEAQELMANSISANVIASGGVSRLSDVVALTEIEKRRSNLNGVIVGKAIYENRVTLEELLEIT